MGCNLRNCYNTSLEDIFRWLKMNIPFDLILFLLDLSKCRNNRARSNALSNFNRFTIFAASEIMKILKKKEEQGDRYDSSDAKANYGDLLRLAEEYDRLQCNGYGEELDELDRKYNGKTDGFTFPDNLTKIQKDTIRNFFLENNNYLETNPSIDDDIRKDMIIRSLTDNDYESFTKEDEDYLNSLDEDDREKEIERERKLKDTGFNLFGNTGNPLLNIPDNELLNLKLNKRSYKCFHPVFQLENYISTSKNTVNVITPSRIEQLKKLHHEVLIPIFEYYFGGTTNPEACQMKIYYGLTDISSTVAMEAAGISMHLRGKAVDFYLNGIEPKQIVKDIKEKRINISFGVLMITTGVHITLPYMYENYEIKGMIVESPYRDKNDVQISFIDI